MEGRKKWFGSGIYGSKDIPIRLLDGMIGITIAIILILIVCFSSWGGYTISFDTDGGNGIASQKLRHGEHVSQPEDPIKPGYVFKGWVTSKDPSLLKEWDFDINIVEEDQVLYAVWEPAKLLVKFDLVGGNLNGSEFISNKVVIYGELYGDLPIPTREGYAFDGWIYSETIITAETTVSMTGEHILTASWK